MNLIKSISIPQPCHQLWNHMTPNEKGRHCSHCCKTVIDFASMTSDEIIGYLTIRTGVCGRFDAGQLDRLNEQLYTNRLRSGGWLKRSLILLGLIGPVAQRAGAQNKPVVASLADSVKKNPSHPNVIGDIALRPDTTPYRVVTGCVNGRHDGQPIIGAYVQVPGTSIATATDQSGIFKLRVPCQYQTIKILFIGYQSQEFCLTDVPNQVITINTTLDMSVTGGIKVSWIDYPRMMRYRVRHFIKNLFN